MKYIATILSLMLLSCSGGPDQHVRTAELTVEYHGKKVKHEKPTWSNEGRIRTQLNLPGKKYIIFGAQWCDSCTFLRRALRQADLLNKVEFINVDDTWASSVAAFYKIESIPTMLVIDSKSNIIGYNVGPGNIVVYLLINADNRN